MKRKWMKTSSRMIQEIYSHYLANTSGPIPKTSEEEKKNFDAIKWAKDYGKTLNAEVKEIKEEDREGKCTKKKLEIIVQKTKIVLDRISPEGSKQSFPFFFVELHMKINKN